MQVAEGSPLRPAFAPASSPHPLVHLLGFLLQQDAGSEAEARAGLAAWVLDCGQTSMHSEASRAPQGASGSGLGSPKPQWTMPQDRATRRAKLSWLGTLRPAAVAGFTWQPWFGVEPGQSFVPSMGCGGPGLVLFKDSHCWGDGAQVLQGVSPELSLRGEGRWGPQSSSSSRRVSVCPQERMYHATQVVALSLSSQQEP